MCPMGTCTMPNWHLVILVLQNKIMEYFVYICLTAHKLTQKVVSVHFTFNWSSGILFVRKELKSLIFKG